MLFLKCLELALFHSIFSYVSFSIQFVLSFQLYLFPMFLIDFNRCSISVFSTSTRLLSSQVYMFICDFKRDKYDMKQ